MEDFNKTAFFIEFRWNMASQVGKKSAMHLILASPTMCERPLRAVLYCRQQSIMPTVKEQLKPIILNSLRITDMTPADLRDDQPLLGGELEIDSVDILQLVLEIERHFGIKLVEANFDQKHFESLNTLASIIESKVAAVRT